MLKRSGGVPESILLPRQSPHSPTLVGSSPDCDIVIKCPGVRPRHALIEYCPRTESFWLRQLDPAESREISNSKRMESGIAPPPYPYDEEHGQQIGRAQSEIAKDQVLQDGALIELRPSDTLRFGSGPDAVEFQFRMPFIHSQSAVAKHKNYNRSGSFGSTRSVRKKCSLDCSEFSLPVVGNRVQPKAHADRFARPQQPPLRRLCHLRDQQQQQNPFTRLPNGVTMLRRSASVSRIISVGGLRGDPQEKVLSDGGLEGTGRGETMPAAELMARQQSPAATTTSHLGKRAPPRTESAEAEYAASVGGSVDASAQRLNTAGSSSGGSTSNSVNSAQRELLQRVKRLQTELARRETEIGELRAKMDVGGTDGSETEKAESEAESAKGVERTKRRGRAHTDTTAKKSNSYQEALLRAHQENERLRSELVGTKRKEKKRQKVAPPHANLNAIAMDTFFTVCAEELNTLNGRVQNLPMRDYADIFSEIGKILHEPFSFRLMEVNSKCATAFDSLELEPAEREQLYVQFDHFLKEKIYPISKAVDSFLGAVRESAQMARESVRACTVFSQWSREFGDQLQLQPNWELMLYKVQDLQTRFREQGLPKHWLPPSLVPLFQALIFEHKHRIEDQQKREKENAEALQNATAKIAELEQELEKAIALPPIEEKKKSLIEEKASIPRIELPTQQNALNAVGQMFGGPISPLPPASPRRSPSKSPRSSRASLRSAKYPATGASEDEENWQYGPIDSPHTPPPSHRPAPPPIGARSPRTAVSPDAEEKKNGSNSEGSNPEEEEEPWGDDVPGDEGQLRRLSRISVDSHLSAASLGLQTPNTPRRQSSAQAVRTALRHLNQIYNELDLERSRSRASMHSDGGIEPSGHPKAVTNLALFGDSGLGLSFGDAVQQIGRARSALARWRRASLGLSSNIDEVEEERRRASTGGIHYSIPSTDGSEANSRPGSAEGTPRSQAEEKRESEEEEDLLRTSQTVMDHLDSVYRELDERRQSSGVGRREVERSSTREEGAQKLEEAAQQQGNETHSTDTALELGEQSGRTSALTDGAETVRERKIESSEEAEFERIERELAQTDLLKMADNGQAEKKEEKGEEASKKEEDEKRHDEEETVEGEDEMNDEEPKTEEERKTEEPKGEEENLEEEKSEEDKKEEKEEAERNEKEGNSKEVPEENDGKQGEVEKGDEDEGEAPKEDAPLETKVEGQRKTAAVVEFWELAQTLAALLDAELPSRAHSPSRRRSSRPQSAGERDARQTAVDNIMERLQSVLEELRQRGNFSGQSRRRKWRKNDESQATSVDTESATEQQHIGESVI